MQKILEIYLVLEGMVDLVLHQAPEDIAGGQHSGSPVITINIFVTIASKGNAQFW